MPPKGERLERRKEEELHVSDEPLLGVVFEGDETETEYELERRYLPDRLLTIEELERLSGGEKRQITQGYISAKDENCKDVSFRLRITAQKGDEGVQYRIARKLKILGSTAKLEKQLRISPGDSHDGGHRDDSVDDADDFSNLWKKHVRKNEVVTKTRYYVHHRLPNGSECEIHYDIHHGDMEGFVRIEVEFHGTANDADAGHQYVLDHRSAKTLPEWIGEDVTDDKRFGGKSLAKNRAPAEVLETQRLMKEVA